MRIAISADSNNGLESAVAAHFGRCPYFALIDVEGTEVGEVSVIDNPFYANHSPGQVPGFIKRGKKILIGLRGINRCNTKLRVRPDLEKFFRLRPHGDGDL